MMMSKYCQNIVKILSSYGHIIVKLSSIDNNLTYYCQIVVKLLSLDENPRANHDVYFAQMTISKIRNPFWSNFLIVSDLLSNKMSVSESKFLLIPKYVVVVHCPRIVRKTMKKQERGRKRQETGILISAETRVVS